MGSYFLHEFCHWLSLRATSPGTLVRWEMTPLRISLLVRNTPSPRAAALNAAAGPLGPAVVGCVVLLIRPLLPAAMSGTVQAIGWLCLGHILFLIPPSTDGLTVLFELTKRGQLS
ncbi:hypothetical protein [Cutibacterium sp.]|uniref:hypothetical protein n=1 Tax=Cutibacterium sp. TaxID=1912221 RepID=UPI0026DC79FF|nr:hypothetical protein [Cutibacterium sp.]MDO4412175.1 hypothetical protein [Cutibacterium sp.]